MDKYWGRCFEELFIIIAKNGIRIQDLSVQMQLGLPVIENDLSTVKQLGVDFGIQIQREDDQIIYDITDSDVFEDCYLDCCINYSSRKKLHNDASIFLKFSLIDQILSEKSYSFEEIAGNLGYSRSYIRNDIRFAKKYVRSYGIMIRSRHHRGLALSYQEFPYRICYVNLHNLLFSDVIMNKICQDPEFFAFPEKKNFVTELNAFLMEENLHFNFDHCYRIANYMIFQRYRMKRGKRIEKSVFQAFQEVMTTREYAAAARIYERMGWELPPWEIVSLAILLIVYQDYYYQMDFTMENMPAAWQEANPVYPLLVDFLKKNWNLEIKDDDIAKSLYLDTLRLCLKNRFGLLSFHEIYMLGNPDSYMTHPIVNAIVNDIRVLLTDYFDTKPLSASILQDLSKTLYMDIATASIPQKRLNIAVVMHDDYVKSKITSKCINAWMRDRYIGSNTALEYGDFIEADCKSKFDAVVSDLVLLKNKEKWYLKRDQEIFYLPETLLSDLRDSFDTSACEPDEMYCKEYPSGESVFQEQLTNEIAELYEGKRPTHEQLRGLIEDQHMVQNRILFRIFRPYDGRFKKDVLTLYRVKRPFEYHNERVECVLVLAFNPDICKIKYYEALFYYLIQDEANLKALLEKPECGEIRRLVYDILWRSNVF